MKKGRKKMQLTPREEEVMHLLWDNGPLFVREMLSHYPDPKPHFNTVSTVVRNLVEKGYVGFEAVGGSHRYEALASPEDFRTKSLSHIIKSYFNNNYIGAVSALVEEEKISVQELKELIAMIDNKNATP